jgi:hypothetical protein
VCVGRAMCEKERKKGDFYVFNILSRIHVDLND